MRTRDSLAKMYNRYFVEKSLGYPPVKIGWLFLYHYIFTYILFFVKIFFSKNFGIEACFKVGLVRKIREM